ncbi:kunitz type trypsin inhibitor 104-like [Euphorbia lathyris]|uniref:kunitz type trypsin inhibitor 104-like n=1 Tax=Euphorbia lathyris TaxID=212925 RepID=UPI003313E71E
MKSFAALTLSIWLISMAISTVAQPAVLDIGGQPVESGVQYYVMPAVADIASDLTLINRNNNSCPLYVGQEPIRRRTSVPGLPVIFKPFAEGETIIRESRDLTVTFQASIACAESSGWRVGEEDPETGSRFIVSGGEADYFAIQNDGFYNFVWCPTESCPTCDRPRCGTAGILSENGKRLLALDTPAAAAFPFLFARA